MPDTVFDRLAVTAARFADRPVLAMPERLAGLWEQPATEITYGAFYDQVRRQSEIYSAAGLAEGHRVALLLENRPDFYRHWLALNALGVSIVPVNPDYRLEELRYLLTHSEAVLAVALPAYHELIREAASLGGLSCPVIAPAEAPPRIAPPPRTAPGGLPDRREASLLYTSGTTGRPKGCVLSNDYFLYWGVRYSGEGGLISLRPGEDRLLQPLPTFHINAIANAFMALITIGACLVGLDRFHPRSWWHEAAETKATCFHYLGVMPAMLMSLEAGAEDRAHSLRYGMGGGVDPQLHGAFEERFGVPLLEGWAMTETGATGLIVDNEPPRRRGTRTIGRPRPHHEFLVVDDAERPVPPGTPGEALIRHAGEDPRKGFFTEYYKDPEATAAAWAGGWFHTGDVMRQDADGFLYFVERKKNIIRRSGENIAPAEIEAVLRRLDGVAEVAVIAAPDEIRGEEVLAFIQPAAGAEPGKAMAEALFGACLAQLAYYKAPGYVAFADSLPLTSNQKIKKTELVALAANPEALPLCFDFRDRKKRTAPA